MTRLQQLDFLPKGYFSKFIEAIYAGNPSLIALYDNFGTNINWEKQIEQRKGFDVEKRQVLHQVLSNQYQFTASKASRENIEKLKLSNTFTVTTGQQIHIFLGPLYVIYKCISTILLARKLSNDFPQYDFVPVFWMATEDHDKDEINYLDIFGKRLNWDTAQTGPVGKFNLDNISGMFQTLTEIARGDEEILAQLQVFKKAYTEFSNLSDATRYLIDCFFGEYGLVSVDANHADFKKQFKTVIEKDITEGYFNAAIEERTKEIKALGYETAVNPRNTNFFYFNQGNRIRIDRKGETYSMGDLQMSKAEILQEIQDHPEKFSPNVIMRPVFQETILPNLAYIGGPSELLYWFQIQPLFEKAALPVPALLPRHHVVIFENDINPWLQENGLTMNEIWLGKSELQTILLQKLAGENPIEKQIQMFKINSEQMLKVLYDVKSSQLKGIKQLNDQTLRQLNLASSEYSENLLNIPKNESLIKKINKRHQAYFDATEPQERKVFFVEMLFKRQNTNDLIEILQHSDSISIQQVYLG